MSLEHDNPIARSDIRAACRRLNLDARRTAAVLADYHRRGPHLLAAAVQLAAMTFEGDPAHLSRLAASRGARLYVGMALAPTPAGRPDPGPDFDWPLAVAEACDRRGLAPVDYSYVLGKLDGEGPASVAAWVELAAGDPSRHLRPVADPSPAGTIRAGCAGYARACLWLRDHRPGSVHLEAYGAAGPQWWRDGGEAPMMVIPFTTQEILRCGLTSLSPLSSA